MFNPGDRVINSGRKQKNATYTNRFGDVVPNDQVVSGVVVRYGKKFFGYYPTVVVKKDNGKKVCCLEKNLRLDTGSFVPAGVSER